MPKTFTTKICSNKTAVTAILILIFRYLECHISVLLDLLDLLNNKEILKLRKNTQIDTIIPKQS